jgi:hypothetical protein
MNNKVCRFSAAQCDRIIKMAKIIVGNHYGWLDLEKQYDLALNTFTHLCEHNDCNKCPDPAYEVILNSVHSRAVKMWIIRRKSKAQRLLEKKSNRTVEENLQLDVIKSARAIKTVSIDDFIDDNGCTKELGFTEDVETQIIRSDLERIYRILRDKPFALKIVELVRFGFDFKEVARILDVSYHTIYYNLDGSMDTKLKSEYDVPVEELAAKFHVSLVTIPELPPAKTVAPTLAPVVGCAKVPVPAVQSLKVSMALLVKSKPAPVQHPTFDIMTDFPFQPNPYRPKRRSDARR